MNRIYHTWVYDAAGNWTYLGAFDVANSAFTAIDDAGRFTWFYIMVRDEAGTGKRLGSPSNYFRYTVWTPTASGWQVVAENQQEWFAGGLISEAVAGTPARSFMIRREP